jgi:hypothetical protein
MGQQQLKWSDEQLTVASRLHNDYEYYAGYALKIKPKDKNAPGVVKGLLPFRFNTAQRYLDWVLKKQMQAIGKIRAYLLKGRQQGCSTYVEGDYFHDTSMNYGIKTFIQTHSKKATANLYGMAHRFLNNLPLDIKPHVSVSNTTDLVFDELDSGYTVSTAGSAETGRSDTIDRLHGSEVAFWKSSLDHTAGLLQAVPDVPGSKIILESTANGMGGYFHKGYVAAEAGLNGDYIAIFIPWYWQEEYRKPAPEGFTLTEQEQEYVDLYDKFPEFDENGDVTFIKKKIDNDQMYWRRCKIAELGSEAKCNQEYPFDSLMAFQFSAVDSHIPAESVLKAFKRPQYRSYGAIVAGFDPAFTKDGDRKAFVYRQGANVWGLEYPKLDDHDAQVAYLKRKLEGNIFIDRLFIDAGGGGYAIYDCLVNDGYGRRVEVVNSARQAEEHIKYANARAEMTDRIKLALEDNNMPLSISVDEELESGVLTDLTAEGSTEDRNNRLLIEKKEDVKIRLGISPDGKDAIGLCYSKSFVRKHVMGSKRPATANSKTPVFHSLKKRRRR